MPGLQNPYVYLVAAIALVFLATGVDNAGLRIVVSALAFGAAAVGVLLFVRQRRDPNGPPGQS